MKCSKCGSELPNNAKFCTNCGNVLEHHSDNNVTEENDAAEKIFCPQCGAQLIYSQKFCAKCGAINPRFKFTSYDCSSFKDSIKKEEINNTESVTNKEIIENPTSDKMISFIEKIIKRIKEDRSLRIFLIAILVIAIVLICIFVPLSQHNRKQNYEEETQVTTTVRERVTDDELKQLQRDGKESVKQAANAETNDVSFQNWYVIKGDKGANYLCTYLVTKSYPKFPGAYTDEESGERINGSNASDSLYSYVTYVYYKNVYSQNGEICYEEAEMPKNRKFIPLNDYTSTFPSQKKYEITAPGYQSEDDIFDDLGLKLSDFVKF